MLKDGFAGCMPAVRRCRGRRPRRPAGQAALCWLCVGRPAHRPPRTSAIAGKFAVRRPTYKPQKGRQRFPVGADSISARGSSRRRALSSGRGPGMPGPYRVAIVPGGMTFLRASAIAGKFAVRHCRGRRPRRPAAGGGYPALHTNRKRGGSGFPWP